jgi:glycosidase
MFDEYAKLLAFRNGSEALRKGDDGMELTTVPDKDILVFIRSYGHEKVLVTVNTRNKAVIVDEK